MKPENIDVPAITFLFGFLIGGVLGIFFAVQSGISIELTQIERSISACESNEGLERAAETWAACKNGAEFNFED